MRNSLLYLMLILAAACDACGSDGDVPQVGQSGGTPVAAPSPSGPENKQNAQSPIGTNLEGLFYWATEIPIIDVLKMTDRWIPMTDSWVETNEALDLDANGWVRSLPKSGGQKRYRAVTALIFVNQGGRYPTGPYVVTYDGAGKLEYQGDAVKNETLSKPGRDVIEVTIPSNSGIVLWLSATDPQGTGNYIRNIRVIMPGGRCGGDAFSYAKSEKDCPNGDFRSFEQDYDKNLLHPEFLQTARSFSVIRSLGYLGIIYNPKGDWSKRTQLTDAFWGASQDGAAPWEIFLALVNAVDADAWFSIPYHADNTYVIEAARLAKKWLEPGRRGLLEYTNEAWNDAFPYSKGNQWIEKQGKELWPKDPAESWEKRWSWYAKRTTEVCQLWKKEWGNEANRITCVLAGQASNDWLNEQVLTCPVWVRNGGQECAKLVDAFATAPYFGSPADAAYAAEVRGGRVTLESFFEKEAPAAVQEAITTIQGNAALAQKYGLPLLGYEGGQHYLWQDIDLVKNDPAAVQEFFIRANRDSRMGKLYKTYLKGWKDAGGELFVHCCSISEGPGQYGSWGLMEHQAQARAEAPKYDAVMTFIEENPCWWKGCSR